MAQKANQHCTRDQNKSIQEHYEAINSTNPCDYIKNIHKSIIKWLPVEHKIGETIVINGGDVTPNNPAD